MLSAFEGFLSDNRKIGILLTIIGGVLLVFDPVLLSMGFSRQECWSGLPFPSPGDLPDPGIEPRSPALQADSTD